MVSKLYKHECYALARVLFPVQIILLAVSTMARLLQLLEVDHWAYELVFGSAVFFLVIANVVNLVFPLIFGIIRYYKNLFTTEGYLSFTLPVSPAQHLFVKLTATLTFGAIAVVASVLSLAIATAGEVFLEILKAAGYLLDMLADVAEGHLALYIVEIVVLLIVSFCSELLLFYTCISIGQLARKNRVLAAVGVYFIYYVITQVLGTVLSVVVIAVSETTLFEAIGTFFMEHTITAIHLLLCGWALLSLFFAGLWFLISHTIIRKKLNLE